jgi:hypothetical protein
MGATTGLHLRGTGEHLRHLAVKDDRSTSFIQRPYFCCWRFVFESGRDRFDHARVVIQRQAYRLAPDPYNPNLTSILDEDGQVVDSFRSATCGEYYLALLEAGASIDPHRVLGTRIGAGIPHDPYCSQAGLDPSNDARRFLIRRRPQLRNTA